MPTLKDFKEQAPQAVCELNVDQRAAHHADQHATSRRSTTRELRRAMALALDRKAFIDIINEGVERLSAAT